MQGSDLIIRTRKNDRVHELIPSQALDQDFLYSLVHEFAYCLDIQSGEIEWRLLQTLWISSPDNWRMYLDSQDKKVLSHGDKMMRDVRSQTAQNMSRILSPLEQATHMHVYFNCETGKLDI
jgi:hypothetical protein